jgi:hypothetical protein
MTTRIIRIICACVLVSTVTHAQFVRSCGLKVGAISAKQTWNYKINFHFPAESRWGIDAGVFVEVFDLPYISVLGELHYIQKGFSITGPATIFAMPEGTGEYITEKPRVDYLSIPLLAKLRFETAAVIPYFVAGARLDFLLGREPKWLFDNFRSIDVGASVGAGLEVPLKIVPSILVEFRYSPSFSEAFSSYHLTVKNESLELLMGVRL